jgi:hypothetical protein
MIFFADLIVLFKFLFVIYSSVLLCLSSVIGGMLSSSLVLHVELLQSTSHSFVLFLYFFALSTSYAILFTFLVIYVHISSQIPVYDSSTALFIL